MTAQAVPHQHERWQIRKGPNGRYCAACGDPVGPEEIPPCCAMPHDNREGKRYRCLTCYAVYMVINGQWTLTDPVVDLTEFPESVHDDLHNPYDLDNDERTREDVQADLAREDYWEDVDSNG